MTYEDLRNEYRDLIIEEMSLKEVNGLKGLYYDGCIAIEKSLTNTEKACILSEELGHHETSVGNIINLQDVRNRKQELRARIWGYDKQIGLMGIINAFNANCRTLFEMAEYLGVTEEYLQEALKCYRSKYGLLVKVDNYMICFEPTLGVYKMF